MRRFWHFIAVLLGLSRNRSCKIDKIKTDKREWVLIDKTILPSAWQQMLKTGLTPRTVDTTKTGATFFRSKVVYTYRCKITKEIKKVVEYNP